VGTDVREQGHVPRTLERDAQGTLVARARPGLAPRLDLGALGKVLAQAWDVFVVDILHLIYTEPAHFAPRHVTVAAAATSAEAAARAPAATTASRPTATAWATIAAATAATAWATIAAAAATAATAATAWSARAALALSIAVGTG
jgi:hypothetical protein